MDNLMADKNVTQRRCLTVAPLIFLEAFMPSKTHLRTSFFLLLTIRYNFAICSLNSKISINGISCIRYFQLHVIVPGK